MESYRQKYKALADKIKQARIDADISQIDLANKLGVSQSYISKIESAQIKIDIITLKELASILKVSIETLIK